MPVLSTADIAQGCKARAEGEDLIAWRNGHRASVTFRIYLTSPGTGIEYPVCDVVRTATVADARHGRCVWRSIGLDGATHRYSTRKTAIRRARAAIHFAVNPPAPWR